MTVEIQKLSPADDPIIRDMIRIEANYMHGDMNGYSVEVSMYLREQTADIHFDLEGLWLLKKLTGQLEHVFGSVKYEKLQEIVREYFADNYYFGLNEDTAENFIELFVVQDSTDDSYEAAARLDKVEVFIYDSEGIKHDTHVLVNGMTIHDSD
jgi:hypothetical protein